MKNLHFIKDEHESLIMSNLNLRMNSCLKTELIIFMIIKNLQLILMGK